MIYLLYLFALAIFCTLLYAAIQTYRQTRNFKDYDGDF